MKRALFFQGGWNGHFPESIVHIFASELGHHGFQTDIEPSLELLADAEKLSRYAVIFPCWTMGSLSPEQGAGLQKAVRAGVGLAGIHGGMGDAFRGNLDYEWMVGGHFVGHPHVGEYSVRLTDRDHPITAGLPAEFTYESEQYYLLTDPAICLLAETDYLFEGRSCRMPVAWTRPWGKGRVFYSALGHHPDEFSRFPEALKLTLQGTLWAAGQL